MNLRFAICDLRLVAVLNRLFQCRVIVDCDRRPYLYRWFLIRRPGFAIFIHRFVRSDEDRALHDHPWSFLVIPLWRGYVEHSLRGRRRVWPVVSTRYRRAEFRHRVELIEDKPAWSLFIRFRERRMWGFWPSSGFMPWNQWWQEKCE